MAKVIAHITARLPRLMEAFDRSERQYKRPFHKVLQRCCVHGVLGVECSNPSVPTLFPE